MKAIDKFILHVVHSWKNKLNEAYGKVVMDNLIKKFREEADDLNISITDQQLKAYIERFDGLKDSPKVIEKDLQKYTLSQLIKLVTASKGTKEEEEEDLTPDVVYNNDDNTIVVYNGSKEGNCINYGRGEKWCITQGSFSSYRYSQTKGYATFYLAKNNNLPTSNKLSFVAIQVRDVEDPNRQYVYTDRSNRPYESEPMSFNTLINKVPWLKDIPDLKSTLKYIPLSNQEKITQQYRYSNVDIKEWIKFPYSVKEQYLVVKKGNDQKFSDISNDQFVVKYLPKYPQLAEFIAKNYGIIPTTTLLQHLDAFKDSDRKSIISNMQEKINGTYLKSASLPFDVKKLLVKLDKWSLNNDERLYVTKDDSTIVKLTLGDDIKVGLYQEEDDYPNIKLNKRTSKYLLDYPELDKIPVKNLIDLVANEVIDKNVLDGVLEKAKTDPNSSIIVKDNIILDSNSFSSYKIEGDKISKIPFTGEEVQAILSDQKDNEGFQQNALSLIKDNETIPKNIDKDGFMSLLKSIPHDKRIVQWRNRPAVVLLPNSEEHPILIMDLEKGTYSLQTSGLYGSFGDWRAKSMGLTTSDVNVYRAYYDYLRSQNKTYSGNDFVRAIKSLSGGTDDKKAAINAQPPMANDSSYRPYIQGDNYYIVNINDPRESFIISNTSGKLNKASVPASIVRQVTGQGQPAAGQVAAQVGGVARRGRPAGQPNAPQPAAAVPAAAGNMNVGEYMQAAGITNGFLDLPRSVRNRINVNNARSVPAANNRGASRRLNILGGVGRITSVLEIGPSTIYFIRLTNGGTIASVVVQPGNSHYLITPQSAYRLGSPSELLQALQQRNLAEIHQYLVNEYMERNPEHLTEFKELLRKHINEKKK